MWKLFRRVPNILLAEMWKELLEAEGIPVRLVPDPESQASPTAKKVYVPDSKWYVVEEVLRKL